MIPSLLSTHLPTDRSLIYSSPGFHINSAAVIPRIIYCHRWPPETWPVHQQDLSAMDGPASMKGPLFPDVMNLLAKSFPPALRGEAF